MRALALALLLLLAPGAAYADGKVTTSLTGDEITIRGDDGDNAFDVTYGKDAMGHDVLVITGRNGTTINDAPSWQIPLNEGVNKFKSLKIEGGFGTDDIVVDLAGLPEAIRFVHANVESFGNGTTSTIRNLQLDPRGKLSVESGSGSAATVEDCDVDDMKVKTPYGGTATVRRCNVGRKLTVDAGSGESAVTVEDSFYRQVQVRGSGKSEVQPSRRVVIERSNGGKVSLQTGDGDDEVSFEDSMAESVSIKLGGGHDTVSFTGSLFYKSKFDGGAGDDCFDDLQDGNDFGASKQKGFEPAACNGGGGSTLEYFGLGADPIDEPPADAVAWRTRNPEIGHSDGPFALPGNGAALGLPERDPLDVAPAHWAGPDLCTLIHLHGSFEGHGDPAPGPPDTESACGHGGLEWARLAPAI